jgi:hypothetical protein
MPESPFSEEVEVVADILMRRRHRACVEDVALPAEKTLGLSEQLASRPGNRCQDARLFHFRFPEGAANFRCTLGHPCASIIATVTSLKRPLTKSSPPFIAILFSFVALATSVACATPSSIFHLETSVRIWLLP